MRILIVISGLSLGGAERQVVLLARELVRVGHRVLVYTLNADVPRRAELDGSGVELIVDRKRMRFDIAVVRRLRATIADWRADVVQSFLYDANVYARAAGWGTGVPVLNSERSDRYALKAIQRVGLWLTRPALHGVVANTAAGARFAARLHRVGEDRVHVVRNGIDLDEVDRRLAASSRPAHALWPHDGVRRVAMVGAIKPVKDHELALEVARELHARDPRWRMLLVGETLAGEEAHAERVQAFHREIGASAYAMFTGARADVLELIASCDALLVTSRYEGFPNVVLEAMACGTPVATTGYSDVRAIVPFAWQVAASRQPGELADIVERCVREHDAVARAQRTWVEANATVRRAARALEAVYGRYATPRDGARPSVCFVALSAYPVLAGRRDLAVVGGAEVQQCLVAKELARRGWPVSMVCLDHGQPDGETIDGVRVFKAHAPDAGVPGLRFVHPRLTSLWAAMRRADADVYYQRTCGAATGFVAAFARRHGRTSVYAAAHDDDFDPALPLIRFARDRAIYRWGVRHATRVVVQTERQRRACRDVFGRDATVIESCHAHAGGAAAHDGPILWAATIKAMKRPELFVDLAQRLPQYRFRLVGGPASDDAGRACHATVAARAARLANVELAGFVPYADIESEFDRASVFVNTSSGEGFPNTFLQAWSRGMPTVSFFDAESRRDGLAVGIVVPDLDAMADAVAALKGDAALWAATGARARAHFEERHSLAAVVDAYERLLLAAWREPAEPLAPLPLARQETSHGS